MYKMRICGTTRYGEFTIGEAGVKKESSEIEDGERCHGDVLEVSIAEIDGPSNLKDVWMVLWGTPSDIVRTIELEYPMAKMETEVIFNSLDQEDENDEVIYTYPVTRVSSRVIKGSSMFKAMRQYQRQIVAELFNATELEVNLLSIEE